MFMVVFMVLYGLLCQNVNYTCMYGLLMFMYIYIYYVHEVRSIYGLIWGFNMN